MPFKTVTPSVQSLNLGICNCFLLRGTSGYALIDTGLEKHGNTILKALKEGGVALSEVKYILLTHAHSDHAGSAAQLKKTTGATLVAHALDAQIGQIAFFWPKEGGVLFAGDAAANTLGLRLSISYEDLQLGKLTLAKLATLPFTIACFGHGKTLFEGAASKFAQLGQAGPIGKKTTVSAMSS